MSVWCFAREAVANERGGEAAPEAVTWCGTVVVCCRPSPTVVAVVVRVAGGKKKMVLAVVVVVVVGGPLERPCPD